MGFWLSVGDEMSKSGEHGKIQDRPQRNRAAGPATVPTLDLACSLHQAFLTTQPVTATTTGAILAKIAQDHRPPCQKFCENTTLD